MRTKAVAVGLAAVVVGLTVPAWAQTCKNQMVLTPATGSTDTGMAEKKLLAATSKTPAVNKFEVDVHAAPLHPYLVMTSGGTTPDTVTTVGGFFTDSSGVGDFEVVNGTGTCSIHRVKVVDFVIQTKTVLSGNFDNALGVDNDPPEVQVQIENQIEIQVQNELNDIAINN